MAKDKKLFNFQWVKRRTREMSGLVALGVGSVIFVSVLYYAATTLGWFEPYPHLDIPLHFFICFAGIILLEVYFELGLRDLLEIFIVANLLFEIGEMIQDRIIPQPPAHLDFFFWDGFTDILVGLSGAALGWMVFRYATNRTILPWLGKANAIKSY